MGLEQVKSEILKEADKKAAKIVAEADKASKSYKLEAKEKLKDYEKQIAEETKKEIEAMQKKEEAAQKLEAKKLTFEEKKNILQDTVETTRTKLARLATKDKTKLLNKLLEKANSQMTVTHIYCNKDDLKILKIKGNVEEADISGGLIVENKDKTVRIDYSFDTILDQISEKHLQEVANKLF